MRQNSLDLLHAPGLGPFLRWRHSSTALRAGVLLLALVMTLHGLLGPSLSPKNLATVLTWVYLRGLLVLGLLLAGNLFCMTCPCILLRDLGRRFLWLARPWPRRLRNKWLSLALLALVLFAYELFDLWASPWWTAWLILAYLLGALALGVLYQGAPFCRYVCPLGQFNMVSSLVSPLEVRVRDAQTCADCRSKDCLKGRPACDHSPAQKGCDMGLYQARKVGNMDCTLRLDCLRACPHDNIGILARLPASELWIDASRSGLGRFAERPDLAALVILYTFGALINAFGMIEPVYELEQWLAERLSTTSEALILGLIFAAGLVVIPAALLGLAAWLARRLTGATEALAALVTRYAYALVPVGLGMWTAHFAFHFLTGFLTIVPVLQSALLDLGWLDLGRPRWELGGVVPRAWLYPIELGMLGLGWWGSLLVAYRLAGQHHPQQARRAFAPWALLITLVLLIAMWLMAQPMEMRATTFLQS